MGARIATKGVFATAKMKTFPLLLFFLAIFLVGCGTVSESPQPTTPVANAGADQVVFVNYQCQLDGSASTGNLAAYSWNIKQLPAGVVAPAITLSGKKAYFNPTATGTYEFSLELSNSLGVSTDEVRITVVPFSAPSIEAGFFGMCAHLNSHDGVAGGDIDAMIAKMQDLGVEYVRFDFDWKEIEAADDIFTFSVYDNILTKLEAAGIKVLGILDYLNTWSNPTDGNATEINRFADFALNTVRHFKGRIKYWQVWNEPNNEIFWGKAPNAVNYTLLLKAAYSAAKQGDPAAAVLIGGLVGNGIDEFIYMSGSTPITFAAKNYLSDVYAAGGKDYFDVAAIHPYISATDISLTASLEAAISATKALMAGNGDASKEVWITELGPLFFPPVAIDPISSKGYTESEVAGWLSLIYGNLKGKVDSLFWYELRDYPGGLSILNPNWEGLVQSGGSPKAAYNAYKDLAKP